MNISKFIKLTFITLTLSTVFSLLHAEDEKKFIIGLATASGYPESVKGFKEGLKEFGLVEGKNVEFLEGKKSSNKKILEEVAKKFKDAHVDLVYSLTTTNTIITKRVIPITTPIVFSMVTYPADSGLIESFEYSGNNLVGTSNYVSLRNYIKLLKLITPNIQSVAIFHRKNEPNSKVQASNLIRLLQREDIKVFDIEASTLKELKMMAEEISEKIELFISTADTLMINGGERLLIDISLEKKIPILSSFKKSIENGSTFGPVADFYTLGKLSGRKAGQILTEELHPSRLESEIQDPPLFLVNKKSLKRMGLILSEKAKRVVKVIE